MREYEPAGSGQGGKTVVSERNDGGPAFPGGVNQVYTDIDQGEPTQPGMSLRDAAALAVLPRIYAEYWRGVAAGKYVLDEDWPNGVVQDALLLADAFIAARERS